MPLQLDAPETPAASPRQHLYPPLSMAHGAATSSTDSFFDTGSHTPAAPTSSATLNSILTTTTTPTIPQKRKSSTAGLGIYHYDAPVVSRFSDHNHEIVNEHPSSHIISNSTGMVPPPPPPPSFHSQVPTPQSTSTPQNDISTEAIDCMCGFTIDDGYSIQCDNCSRWCHAVCFGISKDDTVPDVWICWVCAPRPTQVVDAAVRMQRERFALYGGGLGIGVGAGGAGDPAMFLPGEEVGSGREGKRGRKSSPGHDRKGGRRASAAGIDGAAGGGKRRRRPSVIQPGVAAASPNIPTSAALHPAANGAGAPTDSMAADDPHVDVDEPWKESYIHIAEDIIPSDETRYKLRKQAQNWRGITAVSTPSPSSSSSAPPPPVAVRELPPQSTYNPLLTINSNPSVLPPTYGLHTTAPIPSDRLITPYTSSITPSSSYLSDPLNAYAHLGMPKPFVHLLGPPLDVALDSRLVGNYGRFVRSGCRPNAVLRPVLCGKRNKGGDEDKENRETQTTTATSEEDGRTLGFGVFALRDLKAGEEIVLGWEWDDGNAVHCLPALLSTPHMFPVDRFRLSSLSSTPPYSSPDTPLPASALPSHATPTSEFTPNSSTRRSPQEVAHLRLQMSNILHALSSTFTTCACGGRARDCVLTQMAAFVDSPMPPNGSGSRDPHLPPEGLLFREKTAEVDLGPLVGRKRGFKTRERIPNSGGIGGMEMWVDEDSGEGGSRRVNGLGLGLDSSSKHVNGSMGPPPVPPNKGAKSKSRSKSPPVYVGRITRSRKGKERAAVVREEEDGDVEMEDENAVRSGPTSLSTSTTAHLHAATSPSPSGAPPMPQSRPQTSRPPPPDPPPVPPDPITQETRADDEMKMPPKMRKRWMHHELEKLMTMKEREKGSEPEVEVELPRPEPREERDDESVGVGLGIRIEVEDTAVAVDERDSSMPPPAIPTPVVPAVVAPQSPISLKSTPSPSPPIHTSPKPSVSSLSALLTPTATPTLHTTATASTTQLPSHSAPTPVSTAALDTISSPSLISFANLSLLSPALANGPHPPSALTSSKLSQSLGVQKFGEFLFLPERTASPSPLRAGEGWTPLTRLDISTVVEENNRQEDTKVEEEPTRETRESSIASSSGGPSHPTAIVELEELKKGEDVVMEDAEESAKDNDVVQISVTDEKVEVSEVDRGRPPSSPESLPSQSVSKVGDSQHEDDVAMQIDEPPQPVHRSPTPPPASASTSTSPTSPVPPDFSEPSPTITITEPVPRLFSPPHPIVDDSVQPSPATLHSSLPSTSPSPTPRAPASTSDEQEQTSTSTSVQAQPPKVKLTLQDFVRRKKKLKEKEQEKEKEAELEKVKEDSEDKGDKEGVGRVEDVKSGVDRLRVSNADKLGNPVEMKEKAVEMVALAPIATASSILKSSKTSPASTTTPATPAFDPKAFSEAAAAILNGQHRPSVQHLPAKPLSIPSGDSRQRTRSPAVPISTPSSSSRLLGQAPATPHSRPSLPLSEPQPQSRSLTQAMPPAAVSSLPASKMNDTKEMKKEAIEASLLIPAPVIASSASASSKDVKDRPPATTSSQSASRSFVELQQSRPLPDGQDVRVAAERRISHPPSLPPRPSEIPASQPKRRTELVIVKDRLRSISPMGPDLMRLDPPISPPSLGDVNTGSGVSRGSNAHSRMPSREDGEIIVGEASPPRLPARTSPSLSSGRGSQYQQRLPPAPPSAQTATKPIPSGSKFPTASAISPSPSLTRGPPTGPSYYQRMVASRAGRPESTTTANSTPMTPTTANTPQPEPPKAPRALRQSMMGGRGGGSNGGSNGSGSSSGIGNTGSPVDSNLTLIPSRPPSQSQTHNGSPPALVSSSTLNGVPVQSSTPRGPSADRDRDKDSQESERLRHGNRDRDRGGKEKEVVRDGGKDGTSGGGTSLRDRLDWDRFPRNSGSGLRRWGR